METKYSLDTSKDKTQRSNFLKMAGKWSRRLERQLYTRAAGEVNGYKDNNE